MKTFRDRYCEREVLDLKVRCNNHLNGCDWTGKIKELEVRLSSVYVYAFHTGWRRLDL